MLGALVGDLVEELWLPGTLAAIMFAIGLELRPSAFASSALGRRPLIYGLLSVAVVIPVVGALLGYALVDDRTTRMGLILLAVCPIGIMSSAMTHLYGGRVALSVTLTIAASALYVVFAPAAISAGFDATYGSAKPVDVQSGTLFWKIVLVTVIPVVSGMAAAALAPAWARRIASPLGNVLTVPLFAMFAWIVFRHQSAIGEAPATVIGVVIATNLINAGIVMVFAKILRLDRADARALLICHLVRQEGTGIFVAVSVLGMPALAVPLIVNTIVGLILCAGLWLLPRHRHVLTKVDFVSVHQRRRRAIDGGTH